MCKKTISKNPKTYTLEDELRWIEEKLHNNSPIFSLIEKSSGDFVGGVEIIKIHNKTGEIGITITPEKQNMHFGYEAMRGLIDYAFSVKKLDALELGVLKINKKAIHLYEKVGFIKTNDSKDKEEIRMILKK